MADQGDRLSKQGLDAKLSAMRKWAEDWADATSDARQKAERDFDYYDGNQLTELEIQRLRSRKQPIVIDNRIAPKINSVLGAEIERRVDPEALPRTKTHQLDSESGTDALRYVADNTKLDTKRSWATKDVLIGAYGGFILGIESVPDQRQPGDEEGKGPDGEQAAGLTLTHNITNEWVPWDRIWFDPHSRKPDFSDAKYLGIVVWMNTDDAKEDPRYSDNADLINSTAATEIELVTSGDTTSDKPLRWYDSESNRVQVWECYWRELVADKETGAAIYVWHEAHFISGGFLIEPKPVAFVDEKGNNYCPLKLTTAYIDRNGDRYGVVRSMVTQQDVINKATSKAMHTINTNQFLYEEGSVDDPHAIALELAKPDGQVGPLRAGTLAGGGFQIREDQGVTVGNLQLLQNAKQEIDQVGPHVSSERPAASGREFIAREAAASRGLRPIFDNIEALTLTVYEHYWYMVRQFWTNKRWFRVQDDADTSGYKFVAVNDPTTKGARIEQLIEHGEDPYEAVQAVLGDEGVEFVRDFTKKFTLQSISEGRPPDPAQIQQALTPALLDSPMAKEKYLANDVANLEIDLVLNTTQNSPIIEHEEYTELVKLAASGQVPIPPEILIEMAPGLVRSKRRLLAMIEDAKTPSPEQQQAQQQQQQMAQQQMQLTIAQMQAQIQTLASQAQLNQAKAQQAQASAQASAADAQLGTPAKAEKDQAQADKTAAEAHVIAETADATGAKARADAAKTAAEAGNTLSRTAMGLT